MNQRPGFGQLANYHIIKLANYLSSAVSFVHSDSSAFVILSVNSPDHSARYTFVNLDPAIHFFHIYATEYLFLQFAHI